jgi:DNA-binding Lrp family transcriptional regulator
VPDGVSVQTLGQLRTRRRELADTIEEVDRSIDEVLLVLHGSLSVVAIARAAGLSRQEVHRRIKRARG